MKLFCKYTDDKGTLNAVWTLEWEAIEGRMMRERFSRPEKALSRLARIWPLIDLRTDIQRNLRRLRSLNSQT
jgi:hypothetical protein